MDLSVTVEDVSPSLMAKNPGVILNNGLSFAPNSTAVAQSCRFALFNICRIWSFLTEDAIQVLVKHWLSPAWTTVTPSWLYS